MAENWRWKMWDPAKGDESTEVTFPVNPTEGGRPKLSKKLTGTSSTQGTAVRFEGRGDMPTVTITGNIRNERHDKFLCDWYDSPNKVRITNHLGQQWWAYCSDLEITPRNRTNNPWSATFTLTYEHHGWIIRHPSYDTDDD